MLESEWNRVQYNLSTGTATVTIPYISNATGTFVPFALTLKPTTAGVGANGAIRFSSKHAAAIAAGYDNSTYMPNDVLNMNGTGCAGNNSANAIDRFWVIEPVYYTTRPAVTLDFTYLMSEADVNGGNTASLYNTLQPQRYDTSVAAACAWNGFPTTVAESGTNAAGVCCGNNVGTLTGVQVSAAQFFPDWTLANYLIPLPVEITNFSGSCENKNVTLKWTSASEINAGFYTVEKSYDGINFSSLTTILAAGNSNHSINYTYIDVSPGDNSTLYYRLSETDKNGSRKIYKTIAVSDCSTSLTENGSIYGYGNEVNLNLFSLSNQTITITAYDVTGRLIYLKQIFVKEGNTNLKFNPDLAQGVYLFELKTEKLSLVKRILIEN
jgi:hypothetical protein